MKATDPRHRTRAYILGLSVGTFWLIAASTGFAISSVAGMDGARIPIIAMLAVAGILVVVNVRQIVAASKLKSEPRAPGGRRLGRQFVLVVALEVMAITLVNIACFFTGHFSLLAPLDLVVVGIHFIPLAKLFGVPRYTTLGLLFCVVSILTLLLVPADVRIGTNLARVVYSTLGCAASTWLISAGNLLELRRLLMPDTAL